MAGVGSDGTLNLVGTETSCTDVYMARVPSTIALTRFTLGFHILLDRLWEWETLMPKVTPLPQISHLPLATSNPWENRRTNPDGQPI